MLDDARIGPSPQTQTIVGPGGSVVSIDLEGFVWFDGVRTGGHADAGLRRNGKPWVRSNRNQRHWFEVLGLNRWRDTGSIVEPVQVVPPPVVPPVVVSPPVPVPVPTFPPAGNLTLTVTAAPLTGPAVVLMNSKHLDFARVECAKKVDGQFISAKEWRWFKMCGDHGPTGDPIDNAINPNNYSASTFQGGRQEILSANLVANDWREDTPYYLPASYGVQAANPDDAGCFTVGIEVWTWSSDTNRGIDHPPMAAQQIDLQVSICAYEPPTAQWPFGHYRIVAPKPPELGGNRSWRGFHDTVRNHVIIPYGNGSMNFVDIDVANPTSYQVRNLGGNGFFVTAGVAYDVPGRKCYLYDIDGCELWQVDLDTFAKAKLANIPDVPVGTQAAVKICWHPGLRAVVMNLVKTHAFEVDSGKLTTWPRKDGYLNQIGIFVPSSTTFYDPDTTDVIGIGCEDFNEGGGNAPGLFYWRLKIA